MVCSAQPYGTRMSLLTPSLLRVLFMVFIGESTVIGKKTQVVAKSYKKKPKLKEIILYNMVQSHIHVHVCSLLSTSGQGLNGLETWQIIYRSKIYSEQLSFLSIPCGSYNGHYFERNHWISLCPACSMDLERTVWPWLIINGVQTGATSSKPGIFWWELVTINVG